MCSSDLIRRPGAAPLPIARMRALWHHRISLGPSIEGWAEGDSDERSPSLECPKEEWVKEATIFLLPGTSSEQATAIALALGGGTFEDVPGVVSIAPAGPEPRP